jgi:uncharacterized protein YbjT (DUF2867 family)
LTRSTTSPAAAALARLGATLVAGDLGDRASLDRAAEGVDAMFSVTTSFEAGADAETKQGINLADAARSANAYLVYTSVGSADTRTGIPHFDSKLDVELYIRDIGIPAAIIAPAYFMENLLTIGRRDLAQGRYATPLSPTRKLAQIATDDIGAFAVLALEHRARFAGQRIDIASDELTGPEAAEILSRVLGRRIEYQQTPIDVTGERASMYRWLERVGYRSNVGALRSEYPEVGWHTFEAWARAHVTP